MQIGLNMSLSGLRTLDPAASVRALFANDEPGVWFEANDSTTLFTDVAGTTPVTTPGDAVALQLDKSQQSSFEARRNLLTYTEEFDNAVWEKLNSGVGSVPVVTANAGTAPNGTNTADRVQLDLNGGASTSDASFIQQQFSGAIGEDFTVKIWAKSFDGGTYDVFLNISGVPSTITVATVTSEWQLIETSWLSTVSNPRFRFGLRGGRGVSDTVDLLIWGAQAEQGSTATTYQAIGASLPVSWKGNHRTQATTAARPLYALHPVGGVRNRLTYTEDFSNAVWSKTELTVTGSEATPTTASSLHSLARSVAGAGASVDTYTFFVDVEANGYDWVGLFITYDFANTTYCAFNLASGARNSPTSTGTMTAISDIIDMGGGVYRCILIATDAGFTNPYIFVQPLPASATLRTSYAGDGTSGLKIYKSQLEEGSTATNYQRVGSFLDVSEEGKARRGRIWYNGTSHFMETGTITPGTDKVQVFAGVRKLGTTNAIVIELSTNVNFSAGSLSMNAPGSSNDYLAGSKGNEPVLLGQFATVDVGSSPDTAVLTSTHDIANDLSRLARNAVYGTDATAEKGTGNFLAYPLYFGARAGTSLFFNGYEDTSIIRFGPNLDDTTISKVESYVASKTPEETI